MGTRKSHKVCCFRFNCSLPSELDLQMRFLCISASLFCQNVEISMRSIERDHGSNLIAFSVRFHGYKQVGNLILIILRSADVLNQFC